MTNTYINNLFYLLPLILILVISFSLSFNLEDYCIKKNPLNGLCAKCQFDILTPDNYGGCEGIKKCFVGKNYCNVCNLQGELCSKCELGFVPDKNGGCSYSENCKISYKGECIQCDDNFILIGKESELKICKYLYLDDFKNCKEISKENGTCIMCEDEFFLNDGDKKCSKTENCSESIFGNCISCNKDYFLIKKNYTCLLKEDKFLYCKESFNGEKCDVCDDSYYFDETGNCSLSKYCYETSIYGECQKCIDNYYLSMSNSICSTEKYCFQADNDIENCILCEQHYYLDLKDLKCKSNREENDFKFCSKVINGICTDCIHEYNLTVDFKCTITNHCIEANNGICLACDDNYFLGLDNKCTDVERCIYSTNFGYCIECEDNYYYNALYNNCSIAIGAMEHCKSSDGYLCHECKKNYYLEYNNNTCEDNTQEGPFYKCAYGDFNEQICNECEDGYFLGILDNKCTLINNCKISKDENTCEVCDEDYCLDAKKGTCIKNDIIENEDEKFYFNCNRTNLEGNACEECINGFYIGKEGYCIDFRKCIEEIDGECLRCTDEKTDYGYDYCANKYLGCIEIFFEGCSKCDNLLDLNTCTECKEGYQMTVFGRCVKNEK